MDNSVSNLLNFLKHMSRKKEASEISCSKDSSGWCFSIKRHRINNDRTKYVKYPAVLKVHKIYSHFFEDIYDTPVSSALSLSHSHK